MLNFLVSGCRWTVVLLFTAMFVPLVLLGMIFWPLRHWIIQPVEKIWGKAVFFFCGVKITVTGLENLEGVEQVVFACNHQSTLDIPLMLGYAPGKVAFLAKKQAGYIPILGMLLPSMGHVLVDRSNPRAAIKSIDKCVKAVEKGWSILLFPEGTRTKDGGVKSFKTGSMKMARQAGVPLVPVTIAGAINIMPKGTGWVMGNPVHLHFGKPVETKGIDMATLKELVPQVHESVSSKLKEIIDADAKYAAIDYQKM